VGGFDFGFWNVDFGFPPALNRTADTATAAEGSDGTSLQRQPSVFVELPGQLSRLTNRQVIART
jgi:hypothetical protein